MVLSFSCLVRQANWGLLRSSSTRHILLFANMDDVHIILFIAYRLVGLCVKISLAKEHVPDQKHKNQTDPNHRYVLSN